LARELRLVVARLLEQLGLTAWPELLAQVQRRLQAPALRQAQFEAGTSTLNGFLRDKNATKKPFARTAKGF
jgi:hypothetical protein